MTKLACSLILWLSATCIHAEVTSKGETGFKLEIIGEVAVTPNEAYEQFINIGQWWLKSHTWYGDSSNLRIDPRAGGCFCEISGDNEVLHMLVTFVKPGSELKMVGGLGPLQMMGLHGGMSWRFEKIESGTQIIQTYNVTGYAPGGLSDLADIVDNVQTNQLNALIEKIKSKKPSQ